MAEGNIVPADRMLLAAIMGMALNGVPDDIVRDATSGDGRVRLVSRAFLIEHLVRAVHHFRATGEFPESVPVREDDNVVRFPTQRVKRPIFPL